MPGLFANLFCCLQGSSKDKYYISEPSVAAVVTTPGPLTTQVTSQHAQLGEHSSPSPLPSYQGAESEGNFSPFLILPPSHTLHGARTSPPSYNTAVRHDGSQPSSEGSSHLNPSEGSSHLNPFLSHTQLLQVNDTRDLDSTPPRSPLRAQMEQAFAHSLIPASKEKKTPTRPRCPTASPVSLYIQGQLPAKPRLPISTSSPFASELKVRSLHTKPTAVVVRRPFRGGGPSTRAPPSLPPPLPGNKSRVLPKSRRVLATSSHHRIEPSHSRPSTNIIHPLSSFIVSHPPTTSTPAKAMEGSKPLVISRPATPPRSSRQSFTAAETDRLIFQEVAQIDWSDEGLTALNNELEWMKRKLSSMGSAQDRFIEAPWYTPSKIKVSHSHFTIARSSNVKEQGNSPRVLSVQVLDETLC